MLNIIIPMAGRGSRFIDAGYPVPKPFIDVAGKPMIVRVMDNLAYPDAHFILVARQEHLDAEIAIVEQIAANYRVSFIGVDALTEGTACTVLHARSLINTDDPLLIANSDQIVDIPMSEYIDDCFNRQLDGSILTFCDPHRDPKWLFARIDTNNKVMEVREKVPISDFATVGLYLYTRGSDFVNSAVDMIVRNDRVNGEFYTCPTYNYAIKSGLSIGIFNIDYSKMHGLGTPEDLANYLDLYV